jgi:hypothetical protein
MRHNSETIPAAFLGGRRAIGGNMSTDGNSVYSYSTCLSVRVDGVVIVNQTQYIPSSSKHRNGLLRALAQAGIPAYPILGVERGTRAEEIAGEYERRQVCAQ